MPNTDAKHSDNWSKQEQLALIESLPARYNELEFYLSNQISGQEDAIKHLIISLFAGRHSHISGYTGTGKTALIKAISKCLSFETGRIQCTPDMTPTDILGIHPSNENTVIANKQGVIQNHLVVVDEITRASSQAQAALLEAMSESQITTPLGAMAIAEPFMVLATSPQVISDYSLSPMPYALCDRFMFDIHMKTPNLADEITIASPVKQPEDKPPSISISTLSAIQTSLKSIPVPDSIRARAVQLVRATRPDQLNQSSAIPKAAKAWAKYVGNTIELGASTRAVMELLTAATTKAAVEGRLLPNLNDIDAMASSILRHRLKFRRSAALSPSQKSGFIDEMIAHLSPPDPLYIHPS